MKVRYSPEFKQSVVQKIATPSGPSAAQMAKNLGVHYTSIYARVKDHANTASMKKSKEWTPEAKLEAIIKTVAFGSLSTNLVADDTNHAADVYLNDSQTGALSVAFISAEHLNSIER